MRPIAEIIEAKGPDEKPIVFFDTCSLLDVTRTPVRGTFRRPHGEAILAITAKLAEQAAHVFIAQQVDVELTEHREAIVHEASAGIAKLDEQIDNILQLMSTYGVDISVFSSKLGALGFAVAAGSKLTALLALADVIEQPPAALTRAWGRVGSSRAPARPGKQSMKDCVIIESYFDALTSLRASGFTGHAHFLSSNTSDYCAPGTKTIDPDLSEGFNELDLALHHDVAAMRYAIWPD